jgi:hypothetical protein
MPSLRFFCFIAATYLSFSLIGAQAAETRDALETSVAAAELDAASFKSFADGVEQRINVAHGSEQVFCTQNHLPDWGGIEYADTKQAGVRHLRVGFTAAIPVGSVLVRGGGSLSVLKAGQPFPGNLADDSQWTAAERIGPSGIGHDEVGRDEYATWVLPPNTRTRALRFTHTAQLTDHTFAGWLGGVCILSQRLVNIAPQAVASASANSDKADRINNGTNDGTWNAWENGKEGAEQIVSSEHPEWVMLVWQRPVSLRGLCALWAGFGAADAQAFTGPATHQPAEAGDSEWRTLKSSDTIRNSYSSTLGVNWIDFSQIVTTRAIRLRITKVTTEDHPHLHGKTFGGKRIWLGELMALAPLDDRDLSTLAPIPTSLAEATHPPIAVGFSLKKEGFVTLVIEDSTSKRVRNLVSATKFPAGQNVVWWDGMDDLGRDTEAARRGIYHAPGEFVAPGNYQVRGLYRDNIDLRYEFSIYNAGSPAWETADRTGAWLTNHTPPSAALFVPADHAPGGQPLVFLGSYVSEGGHGLAWVDLNGKKVGGRANVGGAWTGAPYLARDTGVHAATGIYAYVGAAWEGELRLTGLRSDSTPISKADEPYRVEGDIAVLKPNYHFLGNARSTDKAGKPALVGLASHDGLVVASLPQTNELLFIDAAAHKVIGTAKVDAPAGIAFDAQGRLLVLSAGTLLRFEINQQSPNSLPPPQTLIASGLEQPQELTTDESGSIYISDWGVSHQVKVFSAEGKFRSAIGHAGSPKAGPYDQEHMNHPRGLTIDSQQRLWVAEEDFQPKRVSVWTLDGKFVRAFYGPGEYGGGGKLDPKDKTLFYYHGMQFKLSWEKGTDQLTSVLFRPGPDDLSLPDGYGVTGQPEEPIYANGHRYFTNCYDSAPTSGAGIAMLWIDRDGIAVPVAAVGQVQDWSVLKKDEFRSCWPKDLDPAGERGRNSGLFVWIDRNGDGHIQPDELTIRKAEVGGVTIMPDLSVDISRVDGRAVRLAPHSFAERGAPLYDAGKMETLLEGSQGPTSSGGDQILTDSDGWTVLTVGPKPFAPQSIGGAYNGIAKWSYPSLWPGLHASHESPAPDFPGELIGTTRLLGGLIKPPSGEAGTMFCVNGNMGEMYLMTEDGLFVSTLFHDIRLGKSWSMPVAQRGMLLNDLTTHDENFWPSITQTSDGKVYLVDGARTSLVRVDGLESIHRISPFQLQVSEKDMQAARAYAVTAEAQRQKAVGHPTLKVALRTTAPIVDGNLDDWKGADWAAIDHRGVAAWFNSNSKPYDVKAAVAIFGDRLFAAFKSDEAELLRNRPENSLALFKSGGALDLMIGCDGRADPERREPVEGDIRLLVTLVNNKPLAMLYRAVVPGTKTPVPFSSPWRTITIDRVDDVSDAIQLAADHQGNYELSIPLSVLGLHPQAGQSIKADVGVLRGDGVHTNQRVYWSNKATGITADVPSEAQLTPQLWGKWEFVQMP